MISILCPVYNEISFIEEALTRLLQDLESCSDEYEVLVIDNCSTDGTESFLRNHSHENVHNIFNEKNIGKGGSVQKGIKHASGDIIAIFDLDLEYDSKDLVRILNSFDDLNSSLVLGSRRINQKIYLYYTYYLGNVFLTKIINLFFRSKISDAATAIKVMKKNIFENIDLQNNGFALDFEIVCKILKTNSDVSEVPITYSPRSKAEGKKIRAISDGLSSLIVIIKARFF
jgi:glycosyltransferase involved in cell wall biosynthesis